MTADHLERGLPPGRLMRRFNEAAVDDRGSQRLPKFICISKKQLQ